MTASPASVALKEKNDLGGLVEYIYIQLLGSPG